MKIFLDRSICKSWKSLLVTFSEFGQGEKPLYKKRYVKTKYGYLLAKTHKSQLENEYEAKSQALLTLGNLVETHPDVFPEEYYQVNNVFKWRMMATQAKVKVLRATGVSLGVLAEEYKRIADMNEPPAGSTAPFSKEVMAQQANFYADSLKFVAFSKLEKRNPTISDVKAAMEYMKQALVQAGNAKVLFDQMDRQRDILYGESSLSLILV